MTVVSRSTSSTVCQKSAGHEKFAVGISSASELDDASVLSELGIGVALSRVDRAALKVAWHRCVSMSKSSSDVTMTPQANSSALPGQAMESSEGRVNHLHQS